MSKGVDPVIINDWYVVARSKDLTDGSITKAKLLCEDLVMWRWNGRANVWQDLCAHRGSKLSLGWLDGDKLVCAYHGWTYNMEGACVMFPAHPEQKPPSKARVKTYHSEERYGYVWVCLGDPGSDIPEFEEWGNRDFRKIFCGPYVYHASATRAVENFLDVAHFPFVHSGLLGDKAHPEIHDYEVEWDENGIEARNVLVWQPDPDGTGKGKLVNYTYKVIRPFTAYFCKETDEGKFSIQLNVTPVDESNSIAWMCLALNYAEHVPDDELRAYQDRITSQDIPVVESQRPERLPLDLQAELHLRSDRIAIAYRKWLTRLGLTFGVV